MVTVTPHQRAILRHYFAADINAKDAAAAVGLSAERVRQVVRRVQAETGCTRVELARMIEPWVAPPRRRARRFPDGQEALW